MIRGRIVDLQPNQDKPVLELNFKSSDKTFLPQGRRAELKLDLGEALLWHGTINSEHGSPYVHTHLRGNNGERITCTDLFLRMGLAEKALLDFKRELDGTLRLIEIVDRGKWRDGTAGGQRRDILYPATDRAKDFSFPSFSPPSNSESDSIDRLVASISSDFPVAAPSSDKAWTRPLAVRVIDCVLSLNRKYDGFVVPRLDAFEKNFPEVKSIRDLHELMGQYPTPSNFVLTELNYNHDDRARILSAVIDYLLRIIGDASRDSEPSLLAEWAKKARPEDINTKLGIPGFGIAGFQYLRMLMGANTSKPDKHIIHYVSNAVDRSVSTFEALSLLETAAEKLNISLRDLDTNIWEFSARGNIEHDSLQNKRDFHADGEKTKFHPEKLSETDASSTPNHQREKRDNLLTLILRKVLAFLSGSSHQAPKK